MYENELVEIRRHDDGAVVELLLNRPDARNALNAELLSGLEESIGLVGADPASRVVILGGVGKAFCAGMDLKSVRSEPDRLGNLLHAISRVARQLRRLRQPAIARVQGAAIGGGCGLMCVCDFSLTHSEAKLGYPEVDLGVCPAVVAPWLIRKIGAGRARQLLLSGGVISGARGHELGLATHLYDRDELESETLALARSLAKGGPHAMATTKAWLNELDGSLNDDLLDKGARLSAEVARGAEAQSRIAKLFG
ncbi:MAG: enoyl-CoA hydratase/isomerase family protein [Phycisphaerales bacterium]